MMTNIIQVIAAVLVLEAGGESERGMQAVHEVIMNRAKDSGLSPLTIATAPKQFSALNKIAPRKAIALAKEHPRWKIALEITSRGTLTDITKGATHYYARRTRAPYWARGMTVTARIGNHTFLKERRT